MISNYNELAVQPIITFMRANGINDNGIAGLLGNLYSESKLYSNNLQNSKEKEYNDTTYTQAVDSGAYQNFCTDKYGYGLAQWTSVGRKTGMYGYLKDTKKVSISDLNGQIEYIYKELSSSYKTVLAELCSPTNTIRSCAEIVVCKYEVPGSVLKDEATKQKTIDTRTSYAQDFYDKYLAQAQPVTPTEFSIPQIFLTNNDCYKDYWKMTPKGIVVHSTGCNNPSIKRYVQPDDGIIGTNNNHNDWNRSGVEKCVHAFVGVDKNNNITGRQTLPWNICCWGCGRGANGSYNYPPTTAHPKDTPYIQFEICEDGLTNEGYFNSVMDYAARLCAYLCNMFDIPIENVVCHKEAWRLGYASNHADIEHWLTKFNKDMTWFRNKVKIYISRTASETKPSSSGATSTTQNSKTESQTGVESTSSENIVIYTVQKGDTLSKIAKKYSVPGGYKALAEYNGIANPGKISIGQKIRIPSAETPATYTVVKGDGLIKIGKKTGVDWKKIAELNNIKFPYIIRTGQVLKLK